MLVSFFPSVPESGELLTGAIALRPDSYAGVHELAATLQAANRSPEALESVLAYIQEYGTNDSAEADREILNKAVERGAEATEETLPEVP